MRGLCYGLWIFGMIMTALLAVFFIKFIVGADEMVHLTPTEISKYRTFFGAGTFVIGAFSFIAYHVSHPPKATRY